jgi:hypothetical protein
MYIVIPLPVYPTNNIGVASLVASPVEYYNTKKELMGRLKKGGSIRVFEATEMHYQLEVTLTPKIDIAIPR